MRPLSVSCLSYSAVRSLIDTDPVAQLVEQRTFDSSQALRDVLPWSAMVLRECYLREGLSRDGPSFLLMVDAHVGTIGAQRRSRRRGDDTGGLTPLWESRFR